MDLKRALAEIIKLSRELRRAHDANDRLANDNRQLRRALARVSR